jgi:hypothetical protein
MADQSHKNYLELSPEDLEKVNQARAKHESGVKIDDEQLFIAEFGKHYGFEGIRAILNDEIDGQTATWLLVAARKVDHRRLYDNARATFIGAGSVQSKKPADTFASLTKNLIKEMKADTL